MTSNPQTEARPACPVTAMTRLLGTRWTMQILHNLRTRKRFCELQSAVGNVNPTTFTQRLRMLEKQGLVIRRESPDNKRHVEYELTRAGRELLPILDSLVGWAERWLVERQPEAGARS
ncbi:MAG: transcriptional regulator [Caldilineae bacterium]|nr:MAG: transcriptional regulator [Caldilineae bacterium]